MKKMIKSLLTEYGINWTLNRSLYSLKLKMMSLMPFTENFFEKNIQIERVDIFNFDIKLIKEALDKLTEEKKKNIISIADNAIDGVIDGFSSIKLSYGSPINWQLNPITGQEIDKTLKWYKVPDFDPTIGDIKVVWEASRLTHFFYFVRAYLITGDQKYYIAFSEQLKSWLDNNKYSYGANYKCGQEATLRMINVLMTYSVFRGLNLTTVDDEERVKKLVRDSYKKVISNFFYAHKCIKNNHTFTEILGLIVGAWCSNDESALKKSYKLMDEEIRYQFLEDGGFTQYSFNYQRFTLQIIECLYNISRKTGLNITENERIKNSVLLMYQVQSTNGDVPNYGSNDGALIFPVTSCGYRDFRPVLNSLYAFIEGKRLYSPGDYDEELIWFYGSDNLPIAKVVRGASVYDDVGIYKISYKDSFIITYLQDYKSRPAHMDQLHLDLWHRGVNLFCDLGSYSYASDLGNKLSLTESHNTVKLNNTEQMNKSGPFLITNWTKKSAVEFTNERFMGTMISQNGYKHTRTIKRTYFGYDILDEVVGNRKGIEFNFHTPCRVELTTEGFNLYDNDSLMCSVYTDKDIEVREAYRSLYYLKKDKINQICITINTKQDIVRNKFEIKLM